MVDIFALRIVDNKIENYTVGFPKELNPWSQDGVVGTTLRTLCANGIKHEALRGLKNIQILNIGDSVLGLLSGLLSFGLNE